MLILAALVACAAPAPLPPITSTSTPDTGTDDTSTDSASQDGDTQPEGDTQAVAGSDAIGSPCKTLADCPDKQGRCAAGLCKPSLPCKSDNVCVGSGLVCKLPAGYCVECVATEDCPAGSTCKANGCVGAPSACATSKECKGGLVCDKAAKACVQCVGAGDCQADQICVDTICTYGACQPGAVQGCSDATSQKKCASDGSAWEAVPCADGGACTGGKCPASQCQPGASQCDGTTTVATCKADGSGFAKTECGASAVCQAGKCVGAVCSPGSAVCEGNAVAAPTVFSWLWASRARTWTVSRAIR